MVFLFSPQICLFGSCHCIRVACSVGNTLLIGRDRLQGQVENELLAYAGSQEEHFETYIMRPGMVLAKEMNVRDWVRGFGPSVRVDVLARVMVDVAVEGSGERVWENDGICGWKC